MNEFIKVAKRENNTKRNFLILNEYQCKHVPCKGAYAFDLFHKLYEKVYDKHKNEKILFIGFAETATAIGFYVAKKFNMPYMTTTRENVEGREYIYFEEKHSHAVDQRMDKAFLNKMIPRIDRIIFVEDEVSTGNTILNGIAEIKKLYPDSNIKFSVASIVNGMQKEHKDKYASLNIDLFYVIEKPVIDYTEYLNSIDTNGDYIITENKYNKDAVKIEKVLYRQKQNRGINNIKDFMTDIYKKADKINIDRQDKILILGTEEFMFPAIYMADFFNRIGIQAVSHSTTRSPICVSDNNEYPLHKRYEMKSLYGDYTTYIYNLQKYDKVIIISDYTKDDHLGYLINALNQAGNIDNISIIKVEYEYDEVMSTYDSDDVVILLKSLNGKIEPEPTEIREKKIQSGVHYSEMLPFEYKPSNKYIDIYEKMLSVFKQDIADAVGRLSDKLYKLHGDNLVIVSLARAGLPVGVLIKRYIRNKYKVNVSHYTISIIRGKGIDKNAVDYILKRHDAKNIQFVDGWTGKGAINKQLKEALIDYPEISDKLAVIADPAYITDLCGTHDDTLIPSSCLNSTVSGLLSRTVLRDDLIGENDFHGVVYYDNLINEDVSLKYIDTIEKCFRYALEEKDTSVEGKTCGMDEVKNIQEKYKIKDITFIKPGIGETTRVLLRRIPDIVLINNKNKDDKELQHIIQLAKEKNVNIEYIDMHCYKCCGIIRNLSDI